MTLRVPKEKTSVNVLVCNYTNKHIMFNKGEYIAYLEPAIEDCMTSGTQTHGQPGVHSTNSVTLQKMMTEQVQPDTFHPPHYKLRPSI